MAAKSTETPHLARTRRAAPTANHTGSPAAPPKPTSLSGLPPTIEHALVWPPPHQPPEPYPSKGPNLQIAGGVDGRTSATDGGEGESFVAEGNARRADVWVYAVPASDVAVELPANMTGKLTLALDGKPVAPVQATSGIIRFRLPSRGDAREAKFLWHATITPQ